MKPFIAYMPIVILGLLVLIINLFFLNSEMLAPNFEVIFDFYRFNCLFLPFAFLVLSCFYLFLSFAYNQRHGKGVRGLFIICLSFALSLFALNYYITEIEPKQLKLRTVQLYSEKLTKPLRIVHFSDIQSAEISDYEREVFRSIAELEPDLILFTGDFLQLDKERNFNQEWMALHALFKQLNPRLGIYAVFGDTELELYSKKKEDLLPIHLLSSNSADLNFEGGALSLHGLSLFQSKRPLWALRSIEPWLETTEDQVFKIIIGHAPDYAMALKDLSVDLCLAGHTHGGQVRLPFVGPLTIYSQIPKEWALGFRQIGLPHLNVSAGVGSNRFGGLPPIRFNCPTEFTLIELLPEG